jgi:hypothetical protein
LNIYNWELPIKAYCARDVKTIMLRNNLLRSQRRKVGPAVPLVVKQAVNAAEVVDVNVLNISLLYGFGPNP